MPRNTTTAMRAFAATLRVAERVSPEVAAALTLPITFRVGASLPVLAADRAVHEQARRSTVRLHHRDVAVYEWGDGADVVLLVHGWRGRASQFGAIVRELRSEGLRLVAFDAPANGDSPGRRTDILDYLAVIEQLQQRHGRFHAIVGHSFGALAALTAAREGTATGGVVSIAGMASTRYIVDLFTAQLGLGPMTADALAERAMQSLLPDAAPPWTRFDRVASPLPPETPLLLVHSRDDRGVGAVESERLHDAHPGSRLLLLDGLGHNRVLRADATLDAVTAFATGGPQAVEALLDGVADRAA